MAEKRRMPPQSFTRFMVRRLWCTTLFFVALLIALFTATSVYYVVRINMSEKHLNAQALQAGQAADAADGGDAGGANYLHTDVPMPYNEAAAVQRRQFMSRATPAGHSKLDGRLRRSTAPRYEDAYRLLAVGAPLSRQAMRNPFLPDSIPVWETEEGGREGEVNVKTPMRVPTRQRYVLDGLEAGRQYMLRLSFLGSPSVGFEMLLYQVPRSRLDAVRSGHSGSAQHGWATTPQDTELRVFATSASNALVFDYEEEVWLDSGDGDVDGDNDDVEEAEEGHDGPRHALLGGQASAQQRYVPVVEVRARALSIPTDATRLPVVRFNVALEPLSASFLPQVAVPLITYTAWVVVFVGYLVVYTFVSSGIAGGRPHED